MKFNDEKIRFIKTDAISKYVFIITMLKLEMYLYWLIIKEENYIMGKKNLILK